MSRKDETSWRSPLGYPVLADDALHVWRASVAAHRASAGHLATLLDDEERGRASRFRSAGDRTRFVVSHGLLRIVLGHYADESPQSVRFGRGEWGKPFLLDPSGALAFNLSHSGDLVVLAIARRAEVGLDVEQWQPGINYAALAEFCFSERERAELGALGEERRMAAFFTGWARKEAYIKATGVGVSEGLDYFDVSLDSAEALLRDDRHRPDGTLGWTINDLYPGDGYAGAVVARGSGRRLERLDLSPDLTGRNA